MKESNIKIPKSIWGQTSVSNTTDGDQEDISVAKRTADIHYDKEDLSSFHELFLSKPLTKASQISTMSTQQSFRGR